MQLTVVKAGKGNAINLEYLILNLSLAIKENILFRRLQAANTTVTVLVSLLPLSFLAFGERLLPIYSVLLLILTSCPMARS